MQNLINEIIKQNIKIDDEHLIKEYINKYGFYRIIICYGELTRLVKQSVNISTNEIIDIFNIDDLFSGIINNYILDFEKQLNTKIIDIIFTLHQLDDDYVLEIIKNPAHSNLRNKGFATFIKDVYDNAKQCNLTSHINSDVKNIPLKILSTSWTLNTLINFIYLQDDETKKAISNHFGFFNDYDSFISICHTIRKFRNAASHNGIFLNLKIDHYQESFNYWLNYFLRKNYALNEAISLVKLIEMMNILLNINLERILLSKIDQIILFSNIKDFLSKWFK